MDRRIHRRLARLVALMLTATALVVVGGHHAAQAATPAPVSHWQFDEGTGTTAADSAGSHPATLTGAATWGTGIQGPHALVTNGGYADTGRPAFDPTHSFTVTAWVKLGAITG